MADFAHFQISNSNGSSNSLLWSVFAVIGDLTYDFDGSYQPQKGEIRVAKSKITQELHPPPFAFSCAFLRLKIFNPVNRVDVGSCVESALTRQGVDPFANGKSHFDSTALKS